MRLHKTKKDNSSSLVSRLAEHFRRYDWLQIAGFTVLLAIGMVFIYSTGQQVGGFAAEYFWKRQLQWAVLGVMVWLGVAINDYRKIKPLVPVIYTVCIVGLIAVLIFGSKIYGAKRWLTFGPSEIFRIQPSEFAKLGTILLVAQIMSLRRFNINRFSSICLIGGVVAVPFFLILVEPDLGSSLILVPVTTFIIFIAGIKWKYILIAASAIMIFGAAEVANEFYGFYPLLRDYQKERILVFLDPERDLNNRGYNQYQAKLAVGSGGLTGKGLGQGTQNTLGFLPQTVSNNDFIFSVIAEETGFVGAFVLIAAYLLLLVSMVRTAWVASDDFGRFIAIGIAAVFFTHSFVNIGMSIGVMPVTGLPLPLVSYGGSFVVFAMICLGLLQSIYINREDDI